jgi:hypothetical protein
MRVPGSNERLEMGMGERMFFASSIAGPTLKISHEQGNQKLRSSQYAQSERARKQRVDEARADQWREHAISQALGGSMRNEILFLDITASSCAIEVVLSQ